MGFAAAGRFAAATFASMRAVDALRAVGALFHDAALRTVTLGLRIILSWGASWPLRIL